MLTVYLGQSGSGKTFCINEHLLKCLEDNNYEKIYVCNPRDEDCLLVNNENIIRINIDDIENILFNKQNLLVLDSTDLYLDKFSQLAAKIIEISKSSNVIVSQIDYRKIFEEIYNEADEIYFFRMSMYEIIILPEKFLSEDDKELLKYYCNKNDLFFKICYDTKTKHSITYMMYRK